MTPDPDEDKKIYDKVAAITGIELPRDVKTKIELWCGSVGAPKSDILKSMVVFNVSMNYATQRVPDAVRDIIADARAKALEDAKQNIAPEIKRLSAETKRDIARAHEELAKNAHDATVAVEKRKAYTDYLKAVGAAAALIVICVVGGMVLENRRLVLSHQELKANIAKRQEELQTLKEALDDPKYKLHKYQYAEKFVHSCQDGPGGEVTFWFAPGHQIKDTHTGHVGSREVHAVVLAPVAQTTESGE